VNIIHAMRNSSVIGWDIGGVNTKVARVQDGVVVTARSHPYEIQRDPQALGPLLRTLAEAVGAATGDRHAVTMTAELSQMFRTKREGVAFVLDAVATALGASDVHVYTVDGRFLPPADARREPLAVAASNWAATARVVAVEHPNAILVDIGTTTTDIIPIEGSNVAAVGATDPARLASGELVYTGALRTAAEAMVHTVPFGEGTAGVSAEAFALIGDVHVWRGDLESADYSVQTPDGRPSSREFAGERLARLVCADREMLDDHAISAIADAVAAAQVDLIARAIGRVRQRHPRLRTAIATGLGSFIAARAARQAGLQVRQLADSLGDAASRCAPAAAVALLLDRAGLGRPQNLGRSISVTPNERRDSRVDVVVKIGGALLASLPLLDDTIARIKDAAADARMIIVPGGGPFADAVRAIDDTVRLDDDTAHWMAVLAMDQYAHLIAARHPDLALVWTAGDVEAILARRQVPVLAPYRWLREADALPHSWDVTSDSISAWVAGALGARQLVLVKPPGAAIDAAVDPCFARSLPPGVSAAIVAADSSDALVSALRLTVRP
jgi:(4-(4-[2-(gamma-L-glutamylamino)ethyl]phenoxymethyl)furan-2-yl)methanamine synthase